MNIGEYSKELKKLEKLINFKKEQIQELWCSVTYSGISYEPRVQSSKDFSSHSDKIDKIIILEQEIKLLEKDLQEKKNRVRKIVDKLEGQQKEIITLRYIELKSWNTIAEEMKCSTRWVMEIHRKALIKMCELMDFTLKI